MHSQDTAPLRVVLVDDHPLVRDGIRMRLDATSDVLVVGEASCVDEAVALTQALSPDVLITDIRMPEVSGIHLIALFAERFPAVQVLVLSMLKDLAYVQRAMALGARGYVLKDDPAQHLVEAIRTVAHAGTYLSPALSTLLGAGVPPARSHRPLTPKESAVLNLLAQGHSNKEIAEMLGASIRTVESHRLHLRRKLRVEGRAALVKYAVDYSDLELGKPGRPATAEGTGDWP